MTLRLNGSTSGYTELDAPATAGNNTLVLPTGNGSAGNILGTDGAGNLSWVNGRMVLETAKASTSGTFVDFTGIPSWVKRVTVMFNGVSTNGTNGISLRIGDSGGIATTGYQGAVAGIVTSVASVLSSTSAIPLGGSSTADAFVGHGILTNVSGNTWVASGVLYVSNGQVNYFGSARTLSGTLDRIRITTVNGTDTFDAGSINILYEG